jgi:NADPH:quinone reductase-like Zn-dependent oxidoreductase
VKAAVYAEYGPPDVVRIEEVEAPVPQDHEVLVEVHAASLNPYDWHFVRGLPRLMRLMSGLRRPKDPRLGVDVAGRVRAVGAGVTRFKPGDAVFGMCRGSVAELVCAPESALVEMPALGRSIAQLLRNLLGRQKLTGLLARRKTEDLEALRGLLASGEVRPVIDRRFALAEVRDALRYVEEGRARGKVVISVRG